MAHRLPDYTFAVPLPEPIVSRIQELVPDVTSADGDIGYSAGILRALEQAADVVEFFDSVCITRLDRRILVMWAVPNRNIGNPEFQVHRSLVCNVLALDTGRVQPGFEIPSIDNFLAQECGAVFPTFVEITGVFADEHDSVLLELMVRSPSTNWHSEGAHWSRRYARVGYDDAALRVSGVRDAAKPSESARTLHAHFMNEGHDEPRYPETMYFYWNDEETGVVAQLLDDDEDPIDDQSVDPFVPLSTDSCPFGSLSLFGSGAHCDGFAVEMNAVDGRHLTVNAWDLTRGITIAEA